MFASPLCPQVLLVRWYLVLRSVLDKAVDRSESLMRGHPSFLLSINMFLHHKRVHTRMTLQDVRARVTDILVAGPLVLPSEHC